MAEALLENSLELTNHLVDKHFESGWDSYRKYVNGKPVQDTYKPYRNKDRASQDEYSLDDRPAPQSRAGERTPTVARSSASASIRGAAPFAALTGAPAGSVTPSYPSGARRKQRNALPSPEREDNSPDYRRDSIKTLQQESAISDRVLREYELESDDPKRRPESVLSSKDLRALPPDPRRDSAMASGYRDDYGQAPYAAEASRPRSQPPRSRYNDDDDSDYDERSGRRYGRGSGRGYEDDREYDTVYEETERYRGPVSSGPLVPAQRPSEYRRESYRSGYDGPYGAGAVTQYGRRSDGAIDRQTETQVTRRSRSRGRDDRDRSYSRSRSRSRSKEGIRGQLNDAFDTSTRGLGVGLAGAVIGGLAGRQFGHKHRERDILLGAVIGGLGANVAENQWTRWKDNKERDLRDDEKRWENKWEGRDIGRSRSNVR